MPLPHPVHPPSPPGRQRRREAPRPALIVAVTALTLSGLGVGLSAPAAAADRGDPALVGLYGSADPTYDGVFRHSLGVLGVLAGGDQPSDAAVEWLLDQQCADGGFMAFNDATAEPCTPPDPATYTGEDTNSTALAAVALRALGETSAAADAEAFLDDAQNGDGGWPYVAGGTSDPNSTGLVLLARTDAGERVDEDTRDYLAGVQVGCSAPAADRGGIASPFSEGAPDLLATVQAVPGLAGLSLVDGPASGGPWADDAPAFECPVEADDAETVAAWAASWLERQVDDDAVGGSNAAWAVLSFAATRTGKSEAEALYADLTGDLGGAAPRQAQSDESPGALGLAALAATVLGESDDAADFAGRIAATETQAGDRGGIGGGNGNGDGGDGGPGAGGAGGAGADDGAELADSGVDPALVGLGAGLLALGTLLVGVTGRRRDTDPVGASDA